MRLIMGIDPGSRVTGWGIIKNSGQKNELVDYGTISLKSKSLSDRLLELARGLDKVMAKYQPQEAVVEKIFLGKNVDSVFKLGHARGVCMMLAAEHKAEVFEYAARKVKQCLTGSGSAAKEQVQTLALAELKVKTRISLDASDALALAICHSIERRVLHKMNVINKGATL